LPCWDVRATQRRVHPEDVGIVPPEVVVIGDREVLYRGGPEAALARAQRLIPNVRAHLVPGTNHILTLDCPETVVDQMTAALA
jgi:pimeloyl-ACP methyl ester carboxylesterase